MSSSSEEEYQSAEDESSHGPQLASRLGELGLCGVGGEPRGSEVAATVGGTKTDGVATDGNVTSVAKKDSSVGSEGEDESSRGAWGAEAKGGTLSGEDEVEYVGNLDNRYVSEDVTVLGDKVELSEEQVKVYSNCLFWIGAYLSRDSCMRGSCCEFSRGILEIETSQTPCFGLLLHADCCMSGNRTAGCMVICETKGGLKLSCLLHYQSLLSHC